jgi:hypothetical protein
MLREITLNLSVQPVFAPKFEARTFLIRTTNVTLLTTISVVYKTTNLKEAVLMMCGIENIISTFLNVTDRKNTSK